MCNLKIIKCIFYSCTLVVGFLNILLLLLLHVYHMVLCILATILLLMRSLSIHLHPFVHHLLLLKLLQDLLLLKIHSKLIIELLLLMEIKLVNLLNLLRLLHVHLLLGED